ncbi:MULTISPECIES: 3-oxoadipate enol-lactonase [Gammaproteobacteria]|uniref:3-oxoadipate enol-lactonase n=1 Tax=Gammaproteobacteria TaxID=1236 RepID=UPI00112E5221|nr:3-oxoadipate enol-lactonase [Pseudomonas sp. Hp2]
MAFIELATHRLHYTVDGVAGPWLLFCNSLGTDLHMWDAQVAELSRRFRVLRYDRRGHGRSTTPPPPYALEDLGNDVIALLDALEIEKVHFCGLSIGGLTGQWLGVNKGDRLDRLVVCATAAKIGSADGWKARIEQVQEQGLEHMAAATAERWFTPRFNAEHKPVVDEILAAFVAVDPDGYNGCCAALAGADLREEIHTIPHPLLAVSGDDDPVCPPGDLQSIADAVRHGRHVSLGGRHIVNIESASAFNALLLEFLRE